MKSVSTIQILISAFTLLTVNESLFAQDGAVDPAFGNNGIVKTHIDDFGSNDAIKSIAVQPDGKIIAAGTHDYSNGLEFAAVRYNSDGTVDNTFDFDGEVIAHKGELNAMALQPDGKIILAGASAGFYDDFLIERLLADGSIDSTFGTNGSVTTAVAPLDDKATSVIISSNGKIILGGYLYSGSNNDIALVRYLENGLLDSTFGTNGIVITDLGDDDRCFAVALQPDGKILAVGSNSGITTNIMLMRFNNDGTPDSTFDEDGVVITESGTAYATTILPDGKILVCGDGWTDSTGNDFGLVRYFADGTVDSSFGVEGRVRTNISSDFDFSPAFVVQSDGKIIAAGKNDNTEAQISLVRYLEDGSLDSTFGVNGIVIMPPIASYGDFGTCIALQGDNKILVGGGGLYDFYTSEFIVVRFLNSLCDQLLFYADDDGDGYGNINDTLLACSAPEGYVANSSDCNDSDSNVHPGAIEIPNNNIDDDCDGLIDEFCSADFTLVADSLIPHHYWLIKDVSGASPISYLWSWGDGTTDTSAYPTHTYDTAGFYNICLSILDSTGCNDSICVGYDLLKSEQMNTIVTIDVVDSIPDIATAIQNTSVLQSWTVFPNPASQNVFVNYSLSSSAIVTMELHDVLGNKLREISNEFDKGEYHLAINAQGLSNGVYYLQIHVSEQIASLKIVVAH